MCNKDVATLQSDRSIEATRLGFDIPIALDNNPEERGDDRRTACVIQKIKSPALLLCDSAVSVPGILTRILASMFVGLYLSDIYLQIINIPDCLCLESPPDNEESSSLNIWRIRNVKLGYKV